jgi:hypothetical protein
MQYYFRVYYYINIMMQININIIALSLQVDEEYK